MKVLKVPADDDEDALTLSHESRNIFKQNEKVILMRDNSQ